MAGTIRIGISGWRYAPWRGKFYPQALRQADELSYVAGKFHIVEINGTFYALQKPQFFAAWRDAAPDELVFAVKGARFITHMKKLKDAETPLANFFASGVLALEHKLGPVRWPKAPMPASRPRGGPGTSMVTSTMTARYGRPVGVV
jgi:uncharacterized protein YecE (DUF72 family)